MEMLVKLVGLVLVVSLIVWIIARIWNPTTPPAWYGTRRPALLTWAKRIFLWTLGIVVVVLLVTFVLGYNLLGWLQSKLNEATTPAAMTTMTETTTNTVAAVLNAGPCLSAEPKATDPSGKQIPYAVGDRYQDTEWVCSPNGWVSQPVVDDPTPTPTSESALAPVAPAVLGDCTSSELGPWAPGNGLGETYEVTANETVSNGVHVQLWWPAGSSQPWEKKEISVFIPAGLSVEVQKGAGRGWEYSLGCSMENIEAQIADDNGRRSTDTSFYGVVDIDDLISTGLVVVRFDRRDATPNPTQ